jgi:hypothetical protein
MISIIILLFLLIIFINLSTIEKFYQGVNCKNIETNSYLLSNIHAQTACPVVCNYTTNRRKFGGNWDNARDRNRNKPGTFVNWCECCK